MNKLLTGIVAFAIALTLCTSTAFAVEGVSQVPASTSVTAAAPSAPVVGSTDPNGPLASTASASTDLTGPVASNGLTIPAPTVPVENSGLTLESPIVPLAGDMLPGQGPSGNGGGGGGSHCQL